MKKITVIAAAVAASVSLWAVEPTKVVMLYPEGQGVDRGIVENGVEVTLGPLQDNGLKACTHPKPNLWDGIGDDAQLHIFIPKKFNGVMIVSCPGGGYRRCNIKEEGEAFASWCLKRGYALCDVLYRMPCSKYDRIPLRDVQNAFRYCRYHAAEWGVKTLGIAGFSAGGHLAATASNFWVDDVTRPDFAMLFYPEITFGDGGHSSSRKNLVGDNAVKIDRYSMEHQVSIRTPETILVCCENDPGVPVRNSLLYYEALARCQVKSEIHIFTEGGHGFGFAETGAEGDRMPARDREKLNFLLEHWLQEKVK